jgi:hypothetical protein
MDWFVGQFGREAALGEVISPAWEFLPNPYSGTLKQIAMLAVRAAIAMSVESSELGVEVFERRGDTAGTRRTVGHYYVKGGQPVIGLYAAEAADLHLLTAIIAHELGHVRLLGEGRITTSRKDHERLTDLLTVYLGFGVFTANAALRYAKTTRGWTAGPVGYLDERRLNAARDDGYSRLGYLTEAEFGYAMACHAWLRRETRPAWADHLDPGPRAHLRQGLAYLRRATRGHRLPTLDTGGGRISIRVVSGGRRPLTGLYLPGRSSSRDQPPQG